MKQEFEQITNLSAIKGGRNLNVSDHIPDVDWGGSNERI